MRIALFGATGRIGGHVLNWALDAGHEVTVLARDPYALTRQTAKAAAVAASCGSGLVPGASGLGCVPAAGAFIAGDPGTGALIKMILSRVLAGPFADTREMEAVVAASGLDWTLVRPVRLVNTPLTGTYRVRPEYPPPGGRKISRADVAHFIGATLEQGCWLGGAPALAY